jgi:His/Glu/Gln/Arg/opine family amino acid ABC transporter permease subunit
MNIDFNQIWPYVPVLLRAALVTIFLALVTQCLGTVAGLVLALMRGAHSPVLRVIAFIYIWVFRGTPVLLHLFFVYYAAPLVGLRLDAMPAAIVAMTMSSAAYNAEIIRAGIEAVPRGQVEAAQALGMSWPYIHRYVVLPQAARIVMPPYVGNFISHTKNTSLASVITVPELMLQAQTIYSSTYRAVETLTITGAIYLTITTVLTVAQLKLERSGGAGRRRDRHDAAAAKSTAQRAHS